MSDIKLDHKEQEIARLHAEIEQLRAADKSRVAVHEAEIRRLAIECGKAKDEIERLRAALQDIAEDPYAVDGGAAEIARRALENS